MIPPRTKSLAWAGLAVLAGAGLPAGACGDPEPLPICGQIPDEGCPIGRGGTCDDDACAALYDCVDSKWTVVKRCSDGAGGSGGSGGSGVGGAGGGGPCTPVTIDHTGETLDCMPDLQSPDCPAEVAETCAETVCLTGCLDFFLCTKDGWTSVAHCDEESGQFSQP